MKNYAFTLAEVLITLGIIGVVAAITLPTVINKTQENILKQQFKKSYNTITNALQRTYVDNGGVYYECYYGDNAYGGICLERDEKGNCIKFVGVQGIHDTNSECNKLYEEFKSILKVAKVCENNSLKNGCVMEDMKGIDTVIKSNNENISDYDLTASTSGCGYFKDENIKKNNRTWVLADGTVIGFWPGWYTKLIWIDVNGHKKPNKWGHDIFTFSLKGNPQKVKFTPGGCMHVEKGGKTTEEMINSLYK